MFLKFFICIIFNIILFQNGLCQNCESDHVYLQLFGQIEHVKRSLENMNTHFDIMSDGYNNIKLRKTLKPIFDIRFDSIPKHCSKNFHPSSCVEATACTHSSGIYNITENRYSYKTFTAYCDYDNYDGNWLYILKRIDGSENFRRSWLDYVNGFGNPVGEYWIGLENLYALTNFYGPQELLVFLENFKGETAFSRYDHFVIGNAVEKYKLKSLGRYSGTAGDSLYNQLNAAFSTLDNDNDNSNRNCADIRKGGFWFKDCTIVNPTGHYLRGAYSNNYEGSFWKSFGGVYYSHKTIIFMIRRQNAAKL